MTDRLNSVIDNLNELIKDKDVKIEGLCCAVDHLRDEKKRLKRELGYLKSQYDSKVERDVMDRVIKLVEDIE